MADGGGAPKAIPINCEPLAPKQTPSTEVENQIKAGLDVFAKRFITGSGEISTKVSRSDLLANVPNADKVIIAQTAAYLFCVTYVRNGDPKAITQFATQVLPALGYKNEMKKVTPVVTFPKNGSISFEEDTPVVFDNGAFTMNIYIGDRRDGAPPKKLHAMFHITNGIRPNDPTPHVDIDLGKTSSFTLSGINRVFKLKAVKIDEKSGKATFQVL